jgi:hypothetical protein
MAMTVRIGKFTRLAGLAQKSALAAAVAASLALSGCAGGGARDAAKAEAAGVEIDRNTDGSGRGFLERLLGERGEPNAGPCPLMGVLHDSARSVSFDVQPTMQNTPEGERFVPTPVFRNVTWTAEMRGVRGLCRYVGTEPIVMNLEIDMAFGRGPKADGNSHNYRYWVAVTRRPSRDAGGGPVLPAAVIKKEYFDLKVQFPGDADRVAGNEIIERIVIPRADADVSGEVFEVLVGFDLNNDQVEFNRQGVRFRVDVGQ